MMEQLLDAIKKHGALGVVVFWLWVTHNRVEKLEQQLYDCYEKNTISNSISTPIKKIIDIRLFAVLPNEIKYDFKRIRKQTTTS